jgi:hypothetical protein
MINFCTLFDKNYLSRGIALYNSLNENCDDFHIYIFAFDGKVNKILRDMKLEKATIISLKEFEDEQLLEVKPTRSVAEYCWTSTSSTILYVLENYNVESCTYLDADLFFYFSPAPLLEEMGNRSILITEHRYSPRYNKEIKSGKYCVQFVTFKNDEHGLKALKWWRERCLEWCYARFEDGKFGDQLYLDDWTERFEGVHALQHPGGGIAAWNVQRYEFFRRDDKVWGRDKKTGNEFIVIFYHFHYLRFLKDGRIELGRRILTENVLDTFYKPYIKYLNRIKSGILKIDNSFDPNGAAEVVFNWKTPLLYIYRKAAGVYNIYDANKFQEA